MKKFLNFRMHMLLAAIAIFSFLRCQKDEMVADASVSAGNEAAVVNGKSINGHFGSSITRSYADALAYNFASKYNGDNQTLRVAFSEKELTAFIASLKGKYKSDIIYVNFGIYGKGAAPGDNKDYGRMTVFFSGNNMPKKSGGVKGLAIEGDNDGFLNAGDILP